MSDRSERNIKPHWKNVTFDFQDAKVLVTGGTAGIGQAIAAAFVDAGADVIVTGTRNSATDYDFVPKEVKYRQLLLSEPDQIDRLVSGLDELDILINNAGATMPEASFEESVGINLVAVQRMSTACLPLLKQSRMESGASIVNFASMMSFFGSPYFSGYGAAKAGVVQLTKTQAAAWAGDRVRVNAVAPGSIATRMTHDYVEDESIRKSVEAKTPMARWGSSGEIAGPALFLCSNAASFITGHTLVADGGYSIVDS